MQHPAIGSIHDAGGFAACFADFAYQTEQGFVQFAQIGDFRGPIVHFEVDVAGVFAVPGGEELVVPDSLKIGGLPAGLG